MGEKQIKALECLDELTDYASKNKLPMRIIDDLEECKKQISSENVDWNTVNLNMDDILNSMEHKIFPQAVQEEHNDINNDVKMVREQVEKMAKRCRADNTASIPNMSEQKNRIIKKSCEQLMEISHTKAHMEELRNEDLYLQFFQNCKTKYERDSFNIFGEFLQIVSENYNRMMDHMKSMFQNIGGYKSGISMEKFYYEYEEQRIGIDKKIQSEMQSADSGGADITSLGLKTKENVKKIIEKLTRKKKFLTWLPFLFLLVFLAISTVDKITENLNEEKQIEANVENEDSYLKDMGKSVVEKVILPQLTWEILSSAISSVLITLIVWLILFGIVFVLLYLFYLNKIKSWYNHQICKQCGEYLKTELLCFEQTNELSSKLDATMENAIEEYERQYMNVLNNIFQNSHYNEENTEQSEAVSEFDSLHDAWIRVQNM